MTVVPTATGAKRIAAYAGLAGVLAITAGAIVAGQPSTTSSRVPSPPPAPAAVPAPTPPPPPPPPPPPAPVAEAPTCTDPVAGVWVALSYRSDRADWIEHELRIRDDHGTYRVAHTARIRDGDARGPRPMSCGNNALEYDTTGSATLTGDQLRVRGESLDATRPRCDGHAGYGYDLDVFTGTLRGDTYDAVNNDGDSAVDRPYYFWRLKCAPP